MSPLSRGAAWAAAAALACAMLAAQPTAAGAEIAGVEVGAPADMTFVSAGPIIALGMADYGIATVEAGADIGLVTASDAPAALSHGTTTITWTVTDATGRTDADTEVTVFPARVSPRHPTYVEARGPRTTIVPADSNTLPDGIADASLAVTTGARPFGVDAGRTVLWTIVDGGGSTATCTERSAVRGRTRRRFRARRPTSSSPPRRR